MATSADIGRYESDGTLRVSHVSGDGYPAGVGALLFRCYSTPETVGKLFLDFNACIEEITEDEVYFLDGEEADWVENVPESDLTYLYRDGQWFYRDWDAPGEPLLPLTREVIIEDARGYFGDEGANERADFLDGKVPY